MTEPAPKPLLTGSVVFEGWTPEPNALVRVEILDVTYVDAPSTSIAAEDFRLEPATPVFDRGPDESKRLPFTIWGREPDPRAEYIVAVTVTAAETTEVIGRTVVAQPVITFGYPDRNVDVHVARTRPADE